MKKFQFNASLAPLVLLLASSCVTPAPKAANHLRFELRAAQLGGMRNVSVAGSAWAGGAPELSDLDLAERRGIEIVIDLRSESSEECRRGLELCAELGMQCHSLSLPKDLQCEEATRRVDEVLSLLDRRVPTLLVCEDGVRGATMIALHEVLAGAASIEEACQQLRGVGGFTEEIEEFLQDQVAMR